MFFGLPFIFIGEISSKNETNTVNTSVKNEVNNNVVSEYPNFSYNANTVSNTNVENTTSLVPNL